MSYLEKFLEGILEELHDQFDGLPLQRARTKARELLEENLLDLNEVLELFLDDLRVCAFCGAAWRECDMEEAENEHGTFHVCGQCLSFQDLS